MPILTQGLFPDDCVDKSLLKRAVYQCANDVSYYHACYSQIFSNAGFVVRKVECEPFHPVWRIKLFHGTFELSDQEVEAARQIRRLLRVNEIPVERGVSVELNGKYIACSFVSEFGWERDATDEEEFDAEE
ncbi:MAG: hypothetical protein WAO21_05390 [Verrucomicrobiia bacterium]